MTRTHDHLVGDSSGEGHVWVKGCACSNYSQELVYDLFPCTNCGQAFETHVRGKCLFAATSWASPMRYPYIPPITLDPVKPWYRRFFEKIFPR